jgi:putative FmdB family regulatory protein
MPVYEYQCDTCGLNFECRQHMSDDPLEACPECDESVHRVMQPVGVVYKVSGFNCIDGRCNIDVGDK